jgi:integrase
MLIDKVTTWGQAVDYTFKTRHTWRHGNGAKTAGINCGHFTRLRGRSLPVAKIRPALMAQVCIELEEEGKSDGTINRIVSAVSTVLNHCHFDELMPQPPKFHRRKEDTHRLTWFSQDEVEQFVYVSLNTFDRKDLAEIALTAAYTGMRVGELFKLKARDVDLGSGSIFVGGRPGFETKSGDHREVPIADRIKDILYSRMENAAANLSLFGDEWNDKDQLLRAFKKSRNLIGKDESYVFHSFRHSFGTWLAEKNVAIRTIMELMGHARVETTLRYAKCTDQARTTAVALL